MTNLGIDTGVILIIRDLLIKLQSQTKKTIKSVLYSFSILRPQWLQLDKNQQRL